MKLLEFIPGPHKIVQEAIIVLAGALIAALVIGQLPGVKAWIKAQWTDTPNPF